MFVFSRCVSLCHGGRFVTNSTRVLSSGILRLKEEMKCSSGKLSSLSLDVQRREDESADLREKLTDAKKQIQQVQREVRWHGPFKQEKRRVYVSVLY